VQQICHTLDALDYDVGVCQHFGEGIFDKLELFAGLVGACIVSLR